MTHTTTSPTAEELQALSEEMNAWMEATGKKLFPRAKQDELLEMGAKRCGRCTEVRRISEFSKNASKADGLNNNCQPCHRGAAAEWLENNRDRKRETDRRYRAEHREEMLAYLREYHRDEMNRLRNQLSKGYYRAGKAGVQAEWITPEDLLAHWSAKGIDPLVCVYTGEKLTPQNRSLDHCTPISRGGSHTVDNIVPCSWQANDNKRSRTALEYMADRAAAQDPEDLPPLVQRALSTSVPARAKRTVVVQIEEGADNE